MKHSAASSHPGRGDHDLGPFLLLYLDRVFEPTSFDEVTRIEGVGFAVKLRASVPRLSAEQNEILETRDATANDPALYLDMDFGQDDV